MPTDNHRIAGSSLDRLAAASGSFTAGGYDKVNFSREDCTTGQIA
jgi:hypothetical protein